jgi:Ca-activated chloride channel family protein
MAAKLAKAKNIRVYTIGLGGDGVAMAPSPSPFGIQYSPQQSEVGELELMQIAEITSGKYFRATDEKSLKGIYDEIEKLEKRKMEDQHFKSDPPSFPQSFLNWAFLLALLTWGGNYLIFKHNE